MRHRVSTAIQGFLYFARAGRKARVTKAVAGYFARQFYSVITHDAIAGVMHLAQQLDVFRVVPEGVRWVGSVENVEAAKALIQSKAAEGPGDFLIVSLETGWKMEIKAPGSAA